MQSNALLTLDTETALTILPFAVSILIGILTPLIDLVWECKIKEYAEERAFESDVTDNYIDFARKPTAAVRMSIALILTIVSGFVIIVYDIGIHFLLFLLLSVTSLVGLVYLISIGDPQDFRFWGIGPYGPAATFILFINSLFILGIFLPEIYLTIISLLDMVIH